MVPEQEKDSKDNNLSKDFELIIKQSEAEDGESNQERAILSNVMSLSANLGQLLPTGTVLAYQSLSATFTNQGECYPVNWWLSLSLVVFLAGSCVFFAFTDSVEYNGKVYYGVALPRRLNLFNLHKKEERRLFQHLKPELRKRRLTYVDFVHAIFSAVVFLTIAGSDVGLQKCFFPNASKNDNELLKNMPLGMALLSSFIFMIFQTNRSGIGCRSQGSDSTDGSSSSSSKSDPATLSPANTGDSSLKAGEKV